MIIGNLSTSVIPINRAEEIDEQRQQSIVQQVSVSSETQNMIKLLIKTPMLLTWAPRGRSELSRASSYLVVLLTVSGKYTSSSSHLFPHMVVLQG